MPDAPEDLVVTITPDTSGWDQAVRRALTAVVTPADVRAAQAALDELTAVAEDTDTLEAYQLTARGVLAAWAADVRWAGYLEGKRVGIDTAQRAVAEALEDL